MSRLLALECHLLRQRKKRNTVTVAAHLHVAATVGKLWRCIFGTLTYRPDEEWSPEDIKRFAKSFRDWTEVHGFEFRLVWVAELTKAGNVHYHYMFWVPKGITPPMPDKRGWWKKGMSNVQWVKYGAVKYLTKYVSKRAYGFYPKGMRTYGVNGLNTEERNLMRVKTAPAWLKPYIRLDSVLKKVRGFWVDFTQGRIFKSPYVVVEMGGGKVLLENTGKIFTYRIERGVQ